MDASQYKDYVLFMLFIKYISDKYGSERFISLISEHYPAWREARTELNDFPLSADSWHE
jgi:type I restriction-modification system DNA methylase subunit